MDVQMQKPSAVGAAEGFQSNIEKNTQVELSCERTKNATELHYGATPEEWSWFSLISGPPEDLLPVVSDQSVHIHTESKLKELGKAPSRIDSEGFAWGMGKWTRRTTTYEEIDQWSKDPRLGICIQTRQVRAIDVDVTDPDLAKEVRKFIDRYLDLGLGIYLPCRKRSNSAKFLLAFYLPDSEQQKYRKLYFHTRAGRIEFLAAGQQFVAIGRHKTDVHYEWEGGLPDFPQVRPEEFEKLWEALQKRFSVEPVKKEKPRGNSIATPAGTVDAKDIKSALEVIPPDDDYNQWVKVGQALKYEFGDEGFPIWDGWSAKGPSYEDGLCERKWESFSNDRGEVVTGGTILKIASENYKWANIASPDDFEVVLPSAEDLEAQKAKRKLFEVATLGEFLQKQRPEWIVKNVLPRAELAVVFGASGAGKSFFVLDLAISIARGIDWNGYKVKQGNVVYVAAEGAGGLRNRVSAYLEHNGLASNDLPMGFISAAPNLANGDTDALIESIKASGKVDLVVIDTLAQTMAGGNENSSEDMGRYVNNCKKIHRATGALVLLVHHSGKDETRGARGWSGLRAAADTEIEVTRDAMTRTVEITKQKDGDDAAAFHFKLNRVFLGVDEDGDDITSCTVEYVSAESVASAKLPRGKNERATFTAVKDLIGLSDDGSATVEDVIKSGATILELNPNSKNDRRRALVRQAIEGLTRNGFIKVVDGKITLPDGNPSTDVVQNE